MFHNGFSEWGLLNYTVNTCMLALLVDSKAFLHTFLIGGALGLLSYKLSGAPLTELGSSNMVLVTYVCVIPISVALVAIKNQNAVSLANNKFDRPIENTKENLTKKMDANNYFVRNVTHEIRVPVQVITGISSGLIENWTKFPDMHKLKLLGQLNTNSKRLFSLITDVLDWSKFKADKMLFDIKRSDLVETIQQVIDEITTLTGDKNLRINFRKEADVAHADFDEARIMQAARNILSNAIKYAKENTEILITLKTIELSDKAGIKSKNFCVTIANEGEEIPEGELIKIFDPFIQSSLDSSKIKNMGTGLGLSIALEIIAYHNGQIWVENSKNKKGVKFHFAIPISENAALQAEGTEAPKVTSVDEVNVQPKQSMLNGHNKINVLCVDDEEGCCMVISMLLDKAKYSVVTVNNGYKALEYLKDTKVRVDLILLDLLLPGMSGLEVLMELKSNKNYKDIPVFIQSGMDYDSDIGKAISLGALGHISKPYIKEKILSQISELFMTLNA